MKTKMHGSLGDMPSGRAKPGKDAQCDHCSIGGPIGGGSSPSNPMSPVAGSPHPNTEGGKIAGFKSGKEKNYSANGM